LKPVVRIYLSKAEAGSIFILHPDSSFILFENGMDIKPLKTKTAPVKELSFYNYLNLK